MLNHIRSWLGISAKTSTSSGGGGQLPPQELPKTKGKQQSFPGFLTSTRVAQTALPKLDLQLAVTDIISAYQLGRSSQEVLRNLSRANPDLSAAVSAYLRVGIPEKYIALARDPDGSVNPDATSLVFEILQRFDKSPDPSTGFSQVDSIRSCSEAMAKEIILYGGSAMELVLDKARLPFKFQPVPVDSIKFYPDEKGGMHGLSPKQVVGGEEIDLDFPTFFMVWLDPSLLDAYPHSPLEAAIQPVLASSTYLNDMRRIMQRHVYPRYDISIDEEVLMKTIPPDILGDELKLNTFLNARIAEVQGMVQNLGVDEALVHFNWIEVGYVKDEDGQGTAAKFEVIKDILDANLAKAAKVMPSILGNGAGSQNVASTETMIFLLSANSIVRIKLQEMYSKALTLACRLFGLEVIVEFEFDTIDLRPEAELAAFRQMQAEKVKWNWSMGLIGDMEASLRLTGKPVPAGFTTLAGTYFMTGGDPNGVPADTGGNSNAYSGSPSGGGQSGGGAATQSSKSKAPTGSKGKK